jgi:AsmA protein
MFMIVMQTLRRHARRPLGRGLLLLAATVFLVAILFRIVTPFLISSDLVKGSIEAAVSRWTGHRITIAGVSTIRFWPHPEATLYGITVHQQPGPGSHAAGDATLASVEEVSAAFDLTDALLGHPVFRDFHLIQPRVFLSRNPDGRSSWTGQGLLVDAIAAARADGSGQALDAALDAPLGVIDITDGSVEIAATGRGDRIRVENINGVLDWPHLASPAEAHGQVDFRGRTITFDASSTQPLLLLAGRSGQFDGMVGTDFGSARFNGTASPSPGGFLSGTIDLQVPNLPVALRWAGLNPAVMDDVASASASARIIADGDDVRFEGLSLGLDQEQATGLLELSTPETGRPKLAGTLAFDHIDFLRLLAAVEPAVGMERPELPSLVKTVDMDLRLSARTASLGPVQMQDVALGLMNMPQQFRLDVLDSDLQPGRLTGRISTSQGSAPAAVAIRLAVRDADFGAIGQRLNLSRPLPSATGSLDIALDMPRPLDEQRLRDASGSLQFTLGPGRLDRIDLATLRQLAATRASFGLNEIANGFLDFTSIQAKAVVRGGVAEIQDVLIDGATDTVKVAGTIPLPPNEEIALSAEVGAKTTPSSTLRLLLSGGWTDIALRAVAPGAEGN